MRPAVQVIDVISFSTCASLAGCRGLYLAQSDKMPSTQDNVSGVLCLATFEEQVLGVEFSDAKKIKMCAKLSLW